MYDENTPIPTTGKSRSAKSQITYQELINELEARLESQVGKSHRSTLNTFISYHGLSPESPIGDEMLHGDVFTDHVNKSLANSDLAASTASFKRTHLKKISEIAVEIFAVADLINYDGFKHWDNYLNKTVKGIEEEDGNE